MTGQIKARVTMLIHASPTEVFAAFIEPSQLTRFWLFKASAPLQVGKTVEWQFMVTGAGAKVTAVELKPGKSVAWQWSDGEVRVELESFQGETAVTLVHDGFPGERADQIEAALNSTEGFTIVLCDLKTLLETGKSAGLTKSKARLIEARR